MIVVARCSATRSEVQIDVAVALTASERPDTLEVMAVGTWTGRNRRPAPFPVRSGKDVVRRDLPQALMARPCLVIGS